MPPPIFAATRRGAQIGRAAASVRANLARRILLRMVKAGGDARTLTAYGYEDEDPMEGAVDVHECWCTVCAKGKMAEHPHVGWLCIARGRYQPERPPGDGDCGRVRVALREFVALADVEMEVAERAASSAKSSTQSTDATDDRHVRPDAGTAARAVASAILAALANAVTRLHDAAC